MKMNLKTKLKKVDDFFNKPATPNEKAWGIIHDFYHQVLTYMEDNNITRTKLATRLGVSRAAISQMFNKTPNISILKMVNIANAIGLELKLSTDYFEKKDQKAQHESISNSKAIYNQSNSIEYTNFIYFDENKMIQIPKQHSFQMQSLIQNANSYKTFEAKN